MPPRTPADQVDDEDIHAEADDDSAATDADEGADLPDGETDPDGDGGDEGDVDQGDGADGGEQGEDAAAIAAREETPRKRTANDVVRDSKRRAKEAEDRAVEADRKATEALRRAEEAERRANERRTAETAEDEARRVELMTSDERAEHNRKKDKEEFQRELNGIKFQNWDSSDRADFRQLCRDNPLFAKVREKTEERFKTMQAAGRAVSREIIAKQEIADMVIAGRAKVGDSQRQRAAERVRRETTRPTRTRSEVPANRQRRGVDENSQAARAERLKDVQL